MKKTFLITALFFAVYSISVAKSDIRFRRNCSVMLFNYSWSSENLTNKIWSNNNSFDDKWLAKSFDKNERTRIKIFEKGSLYVCVTSTSAAKSFMNEVLDFKVAILRKDATRSEMFSDTPSKSISVEMLLKQCEPGDKIIIYLMDQEKYVLPFNVIEVVEGGC